MFKLMKYLKSYRKYALLGALTKLFEAGIELSFPMIMAVVMDEGIKKGNAKIVTTYCILMLMLATIGVVFTYCGQYFAAVAGHGQGNMIRKDLFNKVQYFSSMDKGKFGSSSIVNRINNDVSQVEKATAIMIRLILRAPLIAVGGLILTMVLNIELSIINLIIIPLLLIVVYFLMNKAVKLFVKTQTQLDKIALNVKENITGLRVIKAFDKTKYERDNSKIENNQWMKQGYNSALISGAVTPFTNLLMQIGTILIVYFGAQKINVDPNMTQGQLLAFITFMNMIINALIQVTNITTNLAKSMASAKRINEVLDYVPTMKYGKIEVWNDFNEKYMIEYKNAEFAFSKKILTGMNIGIKKGQTLGVVGGTGSGKSTLANLSSRLLEPTSGEIFINGHSIKEYSNELLRSKIGLVSQNDTLINGTIEENIKMGRDISIEQVEKSIRVAQANDFINGLPEKLNYKIVEGAKNLSGGQKQRLTIARALAGNPEILILDDSFSALDYLTDYHLRTALDEEYKDVTKIFISQRISAIKDADVIVVIEKGQVVGVGKHSDLMKECLVYQEIDASQKKVKQ